VLRKEDNDCVKKCMEYEVEVTMPRGRPKWTWREVVQKDCQARKLNREDAMEHGGWRKQVRMIDDHDRFLLIPSHLGGPRQRAIKR